MKKLEQPVAVLGCLSMLPLAALFVACNPTISLLVLCVGLLMLALKFILAVSSRREVTEDDAEEES